MLYFGFTMSVRSCPFCFASLDAKYGIFAHVCDSLKCRDCRRPFGSFFHEAVCQWSACSSVCTHLGRYCSSSKFNPACLECQARRVCVINNIQNPYAHIRHYSVKQCQCKHCTRKGTWCCSHCGCFHDNVCDCFHCTRCGCFQMFRH